MPRALRQFKRPFSGTIEGALWLMLMAGPCLAFAECVQAGLTAYSLSLQTEHPSESHVGEIHLPAYRNLDGEYCGVWRSPGLTGNELHPFYGSAGEGLHYISLNPEVADAGFVLMIEGAGWIQEGTLAKKSIGGFVPVGTFRITDGGSGQP